MAESIALAAVLQVLFEQTTSLTPLIIGQFKALWDADIHDEMMKLQGILQTVQAVIEDAEEKQLKDKTLRLWLVKLKDAVRAAGDILDDFHWEVLRQQAEAQDNVIKKVRLFFSSENPVLFRNTMGHRIKEIVERLELVTDEKSRFHLSTCSSSMNDSLHRNSIGRTETHSFAIESEIVGRRDDKDKIVEMLISLDHEDSISVLPVVGMGGLGKTTLAQMIYNDHKIKDHFQLLMWICVSDELIISRVAEKIIESGTGDKCSGLSMDSLQRRLQQTLDLKRYLLVLDDVWNEDVTKWEKLRVLLSHGAKGSAILVTTRSSIVSSLMGTVDAYNLSLLSEEDCWVLFKQRAFAGGAGEHPNLAKIGKEIIRKFGGLPLAAKTVGSFMCLKKEEREWLSVLQNEIWDLPSGETEILPALRLSYNNLPSHLKECFAYCALFPKDYDLRKDVLIQLWMANGLIPPGGRVDFEDKGHEKFNELISRSFLQNVEEVLEYGGNITTIKCKMHDLIHDLARAVSKNQFYAIGNKDFEEMQNITARHVSICLESTTKIADNAMRTFSKSMQTILKLNSFPRMENCQYPWLKARSLRVLALPGIVLKQPLRHIDCLKHLRYLDLSGTKLETLPAATTRLFHLQTLKLDGCDSLRELPMGMKNMKSLRHLCIGGCDKLTYMPRGMGNLTNLQTLPMYVIGSKRGSGSLKELKELNIAGKLSLRGLKNVENLTDAKEAKLCSKSMLQTLDLIWSDLMWGDKEQRVDNIDQEVMECLKPHKNIKRLKISNYQGINLPNWMKRCASCLLNVVEVILYNCNRCADLPMLGHLPLLEVLRISGMARVKYIGGSQSTFYGIQGGSAVGIFPSLKRLSLDVMDNLEEWVGIEATRAVTFFPRLTILFITCCPKLTTMPQLPSVQSLNVTSCPLILPEKGFFLGMKSLKTLYIQSSQKLAVLLSEEEVTDSSTSFGQLEDLLITYCHDLVSLRDEFMRCLCSLKRLQIVGCNNLVGSSSSLEPSQLSVSGGVKGLQLQYLTSLESLRICCCKKLVGDLLELPLCLKSLDISNLPRLVSLPHSVTRLPGLVCLGIVRCPGMTTLPGWLGHLTSLRRLEIGSESLVSLPQFLGCLPQLQRLVIQHVAWASLPEWLGGFTGLEELLISDCCKLISLPHGLRGLTELRSLSISSCQELTSLPEGLEGLTNLADLHISFCSKLTTLPKILPPRLQSLAISGCPNLQRQCVAGGKYWHITSYIPELYIEYEPERSKGLLEGCNPCCGGRTAPHL